MSDPQPTVNAPPVSAAVTAAQRRELQQLYEQAMQFMQRPPIDLEQAQQRLVECVTRDPANMFYADALLANLRRRLSDNPANAPRFSLFTGKSGLKKSAAEADWPAVLEKAPVVLKHNPWDADVLVWIAQACAALGHDQTELFYLHHAAESAPKQPLPQRLLAQALARGGRFDDAIAAWERVDALDPFDDEAPNQIIALTLEKTRRAEEFSEAAEADEPDVATKPAGDGEEDDFPDSPAGASATFELTGSGDVDSEEDTADFDFNPPSALALAARASRPPPSLIRRQELEHSLKDFPENEEGYLELAELYLAEDRTFDAERTLLRAIQVTRDLRVLERLEDVNVLRAKEKVQIARQRAAEANTRDARELVERLVDEQRRLELEVARTRCERYPQNHELKFLFGLRLMENGNFRAAVDWLQGGLELPQHRAAASLAIGECLQRFRVFPKALQCYRQAAQLAAEQEDQLECRKRALYRAGTLAQAMQLTDSAREYLAALLQIAGDYKDARNRLDNLSALDQNA